MLKIPVIILGAIFILLSAALAACTPEAGSVSSSSSGGGVSPALYHPGDDHNSTGAETYSSQPGDTEESMASFDGSLFVASTELVPNLWRTAGWRISDQPIDTEKQSVPEDCTLYPHLGVVDQWIGSCRGSVLIPRRGASNIAVILTNPDGSTTMVQVAPPPTSP